MFYLSYVLCLFIVVFLSGYCYSYVNLWRFLLSAVDILLFGCFCTVWVFLLIRVRSIFYSLLFSSILFYSLLFSSLLFSSILFSSILFYSILFYSILFYSILFYSILFYSILFYSILFYSILFYSILFYSILFYYMSCFVYHIIIMFVSRQKCSSVSFYMAISYYRYSFIWLQLCR